MTNYDRRFSGGRTLPFTIATPNDEKKRGANHIYAVMGITGNAGGAVARSLLAQGEKIRGIVRDPEKLAAWRKQGVELFKADYGDAEALTAAFSGVDGVFIMVQRWKGTRRSVFGWQRR